jgi:Xaa-Pro aminopeptidase
MRRAGQIAAAAHMRAMRVCQPGMMEYQIEAELLHEFMREGAPSPPIPPSLVVGPMAASCTTPKTMRRCAMAICC